MISRKSFGVTGTQNIVSDTASESINQPADQSFDQPFSLFDGDLLRSLVSLIELRNSHQRTVGED